MLVVGLFILLFVTLHAHAQCPAWSFDDTLPNGPSNWGTLCPEYANCMLGQAQSPIDIVANLEISGKTNTITHKYSPMHNFTFIFEDYQYEARVPTTNNVFTFFGSVPYTLQDIHFHAPAEHLINGVQYPLEVHYVHMDASGNYAVVAFMYDSSSATPVSDVFLSTLLKYIPNIEEPNIPFQVPDTLDIQSQVNTASGFYHYEGSTTIPPCVPNVKWFVSTTPVQVDPIVLEEFTAGLNNARPVQLLNNRTVTSYTPSAPSHTPVPWSLALGVGGVGLASVGLARYLYTKRQKSKEGPMELDTLLPK
jgi:carbonic anhydrase